MDRPTPRTAHAAALERRRARSRNGAAAFGTKQSSARLSRLRAGSSTVTPVAPVAPAVGPVENQGKASASCECEHDGQPVPAPRHVVFPALAGPAAARERRAERCRVGRGDAPPCRPSGRMRQHNGVAPKVEVGTTLQGTVVTGTHVDPTSKTTGPEAGTCRVITGTQYAGAEQYSELCDTTPTPNVPKVSVSSTSRGQHVTGTEVGRSKKVTGDEHGACTIVTGTEYLGAEKLESFCRTAPEPRTAKVAVSDTQDGQAVTGTAVGRSPKVTGDEAGACNKLTGSQYVSSSLPESLCGTRAPRKVSVMSTARERRLTGTEVGHSPQVTGDDYGACASVTGTEYVGLEQYQACNRPPVLAPEKIGVMRTWRGQPVSGTAVERSEKVTGDEYGACQPVSGDEYVGPEQYDQHCDPEDRKSFQARMQARGPEFSFIPSGTRTDGGENVTGARRGQTVVVSGTPYAGGAEGQPPQLGNRLAQPPSRQVPADPAPSRSEGTFSVSSPASVARDRSVTRITGTAYGGGLRITGPVDRAQGLVSGTPEFRYRDDTPADPAPYPAQPEGVGEAHSRLTGEGREMGFAITGAAWRPNGVVTGTGGASARRNPTLRGDPRGGASGALQNKGIERAEVPVSKITGSSGNYPQGSLITYSGGARG